MTNIQPDPTGDPQARAFNRTLDAAVARAGGSLCWEQISSDHGRLLRTRDGSHVAFGLTCAEALAGYVRTGVSL